MSYREWYKEYLSVFNEAFIVEQIQNAGSFCKALNVAQWLARHDEHLRNEKGKC